MAQLDIAVAAAADDDSEEDEEILLVKASPQFATMGTCRGDPKGGSSLYSCVCVCPGGVFAPTPTRGLATAVAPFHLAPSPLQASVRLFVASKVLCYCHSRRPSS